MKLFSLFLAGALLFGSSSQLIASGFEDFEELPGFPEYQCQVINQQFVLASVTGQGLKRLNAGRHAARLRRERVQLRIQLGQARRMTGDLIADTPRERLLNNFQALLSKHYEEIPDLTTSAKRLQAVSDLKNLLRGYIASIAVNLRSIKDCTARNRIECWFKFYLIGNLNMDAEPLPGGMADIPVVTTAGSAGGQSTTEYSDLSAASAFHTSLTMELFDDLSQSIKVYFFKTSESESSTTWVVRAYVDGRYVDAAPSDGAEDLPRLIGSLVLSFDSSGELTTAYPVIDVVIPGPGNSFAFDINFQGFKSIDAASGIEAIDEDRDCSLSEN